jgi:hypothetical protein
MRAKLVSNELEPELHKDGKSHLGSLEDQKGHSLAFASVAVLLLVVQSQVLVFVLLFRLSVLKHYSLFTLSGPC